ncbi:MAG: MarR family transcriptional regulator [Candidatus Atribacteria bacterium]|nr:MarR family transcriptional regulator [Candidatus Atribacteria bacterium]
MTVPYTSGDFQEMVIRLQRKMEFFDDLQSSCCGVSFAQCHAMAAIRQAGKISLNDLAIGIGLDKSTVSRTVDNLVNNKMVLRDPVPADRRCITIRLTAKGSLAIRELEAGLSRCFESLYRSIDKSRRAQMMESLRILLEAIDKTACGR